MVLNLSVFATALGALAICVFIMFLNYTKSWKILTSISVLLLILWGMTIFAVCKIFGIF